MISLPQTFLTRMQDMLKEEFPSFLESYQNPRQYGLRINTQKISEEEFMRIAPFPVRPIPWVENGFFYDEEAHPARHPYYFAGLYYLQEPSAMTPAALFPVNPGDRVLDLCAAPGGKATELGAKLRGQGVLVANDISNSRAKALLKNIELFGISNSLITNEIPQNLVHYFPEYFNKILVDAPCSGEGMFRKDPAVAKTWDENRPEYFASLQKDIVSNAVQMLTPGGLLLYSTCTFSPQENEGTISWLLEHFPEMELWTLPSYDGFSTGNPLWGNEDPALARCIRIWPHHMNGEGHFIALLHKKGESDTPSAEIHTKRSNEEQKVLDSFFTHISMPLDPNRIEIRAQKAYYLPPIPQSLQGIHFLRNGLYLGELKKDRFEPSQPFSLALKNTEFASCLHLHADDARILRYLKGETISVEQGECTTDSGWQLVCADGYPLGWGKLVNTLLKNKYPNGWRIH
ncbi:MAG: RsmF rRNA methyltransferase first C-terminal domain-containing protein [Lachnospiraceae bacterium]|jgi:NOL1/NOP2/sun family putative RNA methylase